MGAGIGSGLRSGLGGVVVVVGGEEGGGAGGGAGGEGCKEGVGEAGGEVQGADLGGEVLEEELGGFGGVVAGEAVEACCGQGVDIGGGGEGGDTGVLLDGGVAVGAAEGFQRGGRASAFVVVFREAEIDEYGAHVLIPGIVLLGGEHDVVGLDVEMRNSLTVKEIHSLHNRAQYAEKLGLTERSVRLDVFAERPAVEIFHHVVGSAVCPENFIYFDDIGVVGADLLQALGFGDEILHRVLDSGSHGVGIDHLGVVGSTAHVAEEVLLDGAGYSLTEVAEANLSVGEVGDAEAAGTENLEDSVGSCGRVQYKTLGQRVGIVCSHGDGGELK